MNMPSSSEKKRPPPTGNASSISSSSIALTSSSYVSNPTYSIATVSYPSCLNKYGTSSLITPVTLPSFAVSLYGRKLLRYPTTTLSCEVSHSFSELVKALLANVSG